jgi:hypothetical protein
LSGSGEQEEPSLMTTAPWVYTDPDSKSTLMVCPGSEPGIVTVEAHDPRDNAIVRVPLPAGAVPGLTAAVAAAAGTANPVVLPRRDIPKRGGVATALGDVGAGSDGLVHITDGPGERTMSPADTRIAASALASAADLAGSEPDPSVSAPLAAAILPALIGAELALPEGAARAVADAAARAALRAGYIPPAWTQPSARRPARRGSR